MAVEVSRIGYTRLFDVRLLHHYWLDEGTKPFDSIVDPTLRAQRLLAYDVRKVLTVEPSATTRTLLAGLRGVFRMTGAGFLVAVPDDARVPLDATFEFHLTAEDPQYATYTALSLRPRTITDVVDPADPRTVRRYKADVPVLSNLTGTPVGAGTGERLYLSRPYVDGADAGDGVEALVTVGDELRQLTGDPPSAPSAVLGPKADHPVYVHQLDVPATTPPLGSTGAPGRGIELTPDMPPGVALVLRLAPRRADHASYSFANPDGSPVTPTVVYEVHLRNRWTYWRYRNRRTGSVTATETAPLPLAHFGALGNRRRPSTAAVDVELDSADPSRITRLISDIYV